MNDADPENASHPGNDAVTPEASSTDEMLPCPNCHYDLRGLPSGRCPECNAAFDQADLQPVRENLALERWQADTTSRWQRLFFPWRVGFSPIAAFRRECPIEYTLTSSPGRFIVWMIPAFVLLALAGNAVSYLVDDLRGIYAVLCDAHGGAGWRHCSLTLLPVQLPILWLQSVAVCILGMVVGWRVLTVRQIIYLATWVTAIGLFAQSLAMLYEVAWDTFLSNVFMSPLFFSSEVIIEFRNAVQELEIRSSDLFFGLLAGFAVGTVMGRRRWLLAILAAGILYMGFPLYVSVQFNYGYRLHKPVHDAILGAPLPLPDLSNGPSFDPDQVESSLAGYWTVDCDTGQAMTITEILIDTNGELIHFQITSPDTNQQYRFIADEVLHEIDVTDWNGNPAKTSYRSSGGCHRERSKVVINTRLEWHIPLDNTSTVNIYEMTLSGTFNEDSETIEGTNKYVVDSKFAAILYPRREYSFTMHRLPAAETPTTQPSP